MSIIKIKQPFDWDTLPQGLEASGDILGLAVGGGGMDVSAITGALPEAPWSKNGGLSPYTIYDGHCLVLDDDSNVDHLYYEIPWTADLGSAGSGGCSCHLHLNSRNNYNPWENCKVVWDDGIDRFFLEFRTGGTFHDNAGLISGDHILPMELYVSIRGGVMESYQFNPWTRQWALKRTTSATAGLADHIAFGSFDDVTAGYGHFFFLRHKEAYHATPLSAASPVAVMGEITGDGVPIEQVPITESVVSGASVSYRYDLNRAGWSAARTLAELTAELVGQPLYYLDLEATFISDGLSTASLDINGGVIASATMAAFNLPLEVIEQPALEVIEV